MIASVATRLVVWKMCWKPRGSVLRDQALLHPKICLRGPGSQALLKSNTNEQASHAARDEWKMMPCRHPLQMCLQKWVWRGSLGDTSAGSWVFLASWTYVDLHEHPQLKMTFVPTLVLVAMRSMPRISPHQFISIFLRENQRESPWSGSIWIIAMWHQYGIQCSGHRLIPVRAPKAHCRHRGRGSGWYLSGRGMGHDRDMSRKTLGCWPTHIVREQIENR